MLPNELIYNGIRRKVERWEASWSLALHQVPHVLWIKWEGATKYERFTSDNTGGFHGLDVPDTL